MDGSSQTATAPRDLVGSVQYEPLEDVDCGSTFFIPLSISLPSYVAVGRRINWRRLRQVQNVSSYSRLGREDSGQFAKSSMDVVGLSLFPSYRQPSR